MNNKQLNSVSIETQLKLNIIKIEALDLDKETLSYLKERNIHTLHDFISLYEKESYNYNVSPSTARANNNLLVKFGIKLDMKKRTTFSFGIGLEINASDVTEVLLDAVIRKGRFVKLDTQGEKAIFAKLLIEVQMIEDLGFSYATYKYLKSIGVCDLYDIIELPWNSKKTYTPYFTQNKMDEIIAKMNELGYDFNNNVFKRRYNAKIEETLFNFLPEYAKKNYILGIQHQIEKEVKEKSLVEQIISSHINSNLTKQKAPYSHNKFKRVILNSAKRTNKIPDSEVLSILDENINNIYSLSNGFIKLYEHIILNKIFDSSASINEKRKLVDFVNQITSPNFEFNLND